MKTKVSSEGNSLIEFVSLVSSDAILDPGQMMKVRGGDGELPAPNLPPPPIKP